MASLNQSVALIGEPQPRGFQPCPGDVTKCWLWGQPPHNLAKAYSTEHSPKMMSSGPDFHPCQVTIGIQV